MRNTAILITTFMRDERLYTCVESIRKFYPKIRIYVVDQGKTSYQKEKFFTDNKCFPIALPWDSGLALSRNVGMHVSKEKYVVIIDDDFIFTEETDLKKWRKLLDNLPKVGVVAGRLIHRGVDWHYECELKLKKNCYVMKEIKEPKWFKLGKIPYHYCDLALNFLMLRRECWNDVPWDSDYRIVHEHLAYFLDLKYHSKWKTIYTPEVAAIHDKRPYKPEYEVLRSARGRKKKSWYTYHLKTGIKFGIYMMNVMGGLKVLDLTTGEFISQHELFLDKIHKQREEKRLKELKEIGSSRDALEEIKEQKIETEKDQILMARKKQFWEQRSRQKVIASSKTLNDRAFALAIWILDKYKCRWWLMAGTCLGAIRENRFLTSDIDIGLSAKNLNLWEVLIAEFEKAGFELFQEWRYKDKKMELAFELKSETSKTKLDLFFYYEDGQYIWHGLFGPDGQKRWDEAHRVFYPVVFNKVYFENLKRINFRGFSCLVPNPPEGYLVEWYGDWETPTRDYISWRDCRAIRKDFKIAG